MEASRCRSSGGVERQNGSGEGGGRVLRKSRMLPENYPKNYAPPKHPHPPPKSYAELANDTLASGPAPPKHRQPTSAAADERAGRPSRSRMLGPCSSFWEQKWTLGAGPAYSSCYLDGSESRTVFKPHNVFEPRVQPPPKTTSKVILGQDGGDLRTTKGIDFDPEPRGHPLEYRRQMIRIPDNDIQLGTTHREYTSTSKQFQTTALMSREERREAGKAATKMSGYNILTGGPAIATYSFDGYDRRRDYKRHEMIRRDGGTPTRATTVGDCLAML